MIESLCDSCKNLLCIEYKDDSKKYGCVYHPLPPTNVKTCSHYKNKNAKLH